ncbi:MAG: hypothetical protein GX211_00290 [Clostridiaceae bacterium]|nr:hypothetical protein [Clostridiaceae bacterium]
MKNLSFHNQKRCNAGTINTVKALKASRGSATVEAAVILPVIIIVFISILSIIRIAGTYDRVQYALNQVAADLSQYSYLYTVLGLQEGHDEIIDDIENAKNEFFKQQNVINTFYGTIQSITGDISFTGQENDINALIGLVDNIQNIGNSYDDLSAQIEKVLTDPMGELRIIALALSDKLFSGSKTELFSIVSKSIMKEKLSNSLSITVSDLEKNLGIKGGINGLDFSRSSFLDDKQTIDLVVEYTVKPVTGFAIVPEVRLRNRSCVLAWTSGSDRIRTHEDTDDESLWNNDINTDPRIQHMNRGIEIEKRFAAELIKPFGENGKVTPHFFPVVDAVKYGHGNEIEKIYSMISLNPFLSSYKTKNVIIGKIKNLIDKLHNFSGGEKNGFVIDITPKNTVLKRVVYVIVPENSSLPEAFHEAFEECSKYCSGFGIELYYEQKYGEYANGKEDTENDG